MTKEQEEITISLIGEAKTKTEVYDAVKDLFTKINSDQLKKFISDHWEITPKLHNISLRKLNYKQKHSLMIDLLHKRDTNDLKKIYLYLKGDMPKGIPTEMYNAVVKKQLPKREELRGKRVVLNYMTDDRIRIDVSEEQGFFRHEFTIWDIDCRKTIEILY